MQVNQHPIAQEELMAYLDGELSPDRAALAQEHLEHCDDCLRLTADFRSVSMRLAAWQVERSSERLPETTASALDKRRRTKKNALWPVIATAAALLVLAVAIIEPKISRQARVSLAPHYQLSAEKASPAPDLLRAGSPLIVRSAQLTLTTKEFDKARISLDEILKRHRGYIGHLNVAAPAGTGRTLDASLRVPADQLDAVTAEVKKLGRVDAESQTGEEVTQQYTDLDARLANARNTEQRLNGLIRDRSGKMTDVLAVEGELSRVRGNIEQMEAQKKALVNKVDFATLNLMLIEDEAKPAHSRLGRFHEAAASGYDSLVDGLTGLAVFLLAYGPSVVLWGGLALLIILLGWRWLRRLKSLTLNAD
ncbi:MAG TPA: DUF4349 domain-containing protein [Bryobacteraceae bacterium]|nr:DUF4349 domain-containing protein [Bryobacteraceae bacterium]